MSTLGSNVYHYLKAEIHMYSYVHWSSLLEKYKIKKKDYKMPKNLSELMAAHPAHAGFPSAGAHLGWWMPSWTKPHWELLSSWDAYQQHAGGHARRHDLQVILTESGSGYNHQGHPCPSWGAEIPLGREWKCTDDDPVQKVHKCSADPDLLLWKVKWNHELSFGTSCSDFCILDSAHQGKPCCYLDGLFR